MALYGSCNQACGMEALDCGHFGPSIPWRTSSQVGGPLTRQKEGAAAQQGHGLCSSPGSLVPAHQHLNSLGWGFQGTALSQATVRHQVFCVVLKTAVYSALFILFLDFQSFIISVLRDVNPLVREDLIHHGCAPNAYSIMNHWVNSKSEGMEINMCIAS